MRVIDVARGVLTSWTIEGVQFDAVHYARCCAPDENQSRLERIEKVTRAAGLDVDDAVTVAVLTGHPRWQEIVLNDVLFPRFKAKEDAQEFRKWCETVGLQLRPQHVRALCAQILADPSVETAKDEVVEGLYELYDLAEGRSGKSRPSGVDWEMERVALLLWNTPEMALGLAAGLDGEPLGPKRAERWLSNLARALAILRRAGWRKSTGDWSLLRRAIAHSLRDEKPGALCRTLAFELTSSFLPICRCLGVPTTDRGVWFKQVAEWIDSRPADEVQQRSRDAWIEDLLDAFSGDTQKNALLEELCRAWLNLPAGDSQRSTEWRLMTAPECASKEAWLVITPILIEAINKNSIWSVAERCCLLVHEPVMDEPSRNTVLAHVSARLQNALSDDIDNMAPEPKQARDILLKLQDVSPLFTAAAQAAKAATNVSDVQHLKLLWEAVLSPPERRRIMATGLLLFAAARQQIAGTEAEVAGLTDLRTHLMSKQEDTSSS